MLVAEVGGYGCSAAIGDARAKAPLGEVIESSAKGRGLRLPGNGPSSSYGSSRRPEAFPGSGTFLRAVASIEMSYQSLSVAPL